MGRSGFHFNLWIKVLAGRNCRRNSSRHQYPVNEAAVKALGLKSNENAIGKDIQYGRRKGKLIGVFNDFHFESHAPEDCSNDFVRTHQPRILTRVSVKIAGNNIPAALASIEATWKKFLPDIPYEYNFLDENFEKLYKSEEKQGVIFTMFSCIAIFIACLGLFGLSAFAITQRIKEIGIRKVLGASIRNIVALLSKDFLKLVAISALIAFPVAWYAMHNWLQDFAYRIHLSWWIFIAAGIIAALVALATISFQAVRAALANPVKSLRTE